MLALGNRLLSLGEVKQAEVSSEEDPWARDAKSRGSRMLLSRLPPSCWLIV